ncbi:MAG: glycosyltransferase [Planctomycetaceae bacterium]
MTFSDWTHWLSSLHPEEWPTLIIGLLLLDLPRYALSRLLVCLWDIVTFARRGPLGDQASSRFRHCPSVCVILAGYNEGETIEGTIRSVSGSYPNLQIIVVDDGSEDDMYDRARRAARDRPDVLVLKRPRRGGKSSAMNTALVYTQAEVVICVDADSALGPAAIWEIVQPFADPQVGIVSATILARNAGCNLVTRIQAYEYLQSIFVGRMASERAKILGIASGAYAAVRRDVLVQVGGWDVGPPEDLDLTLRVRKAGYDVGLAPYAVCYTDVPATWKALIRQRFRWDQGAVVRCFMRKHSDLANLRNRNFRWENLLLTIDQWLFQFLCPYGFVLYVAWFLLHPLENPAFIVFGLYVMALLFELVQVATLAFYSTNLRRDLATSLVFPLIPFYQLLMMGVRVIANTQELLYRRSFDDNYVPQHVRRATWHW